VFVGSFRTRLDFGLWLVGWRELVGAAHHKVRSIAL
jgi:hypothetical protein